MNISLLVLDELMSQLNETKRKKRDPTLPVTAIIILWHDIFSIHKPGGNQL